ncbi:hypothetical protein TIFTF001_043797 [Ficus carica]|uniref:Uncharacterized protein n=1 Tax=Ficus carica TaxID=3494 RepID=A0AA88CKC4_FICCA|nr:hypothetical protein TIFTF001_043797 [Ficus carica]
MKMMTASGHSVCIDLACVKARNPVETLFLGQPWDLQLPMDRASSSLCLKLRTKKARLALVLVGCGGWDMEICC